MVSVDVKHHVYLLTLNIRFGSSVALTPIIAKCFEKVVSKQLKFDVVDQLDPFQFAYKASRGVEGASLTLLNLMSNFKYLGTLIDNKLSFSDNSDLIYKKSQQRLYLLRKLRSLDVSRELLQIVYKSLVESVLTFNIVVWYGNLGVKGKAKLARIVGMAGKIIGAKQDSTSDLYLTAVELKTAWILDDAKHPLFSQFLKLRSGRRYKVPIARKNVYKKSFIPSAISVLNSRAT